ncbi:MAG: beta strand repeat-containing protein [Solirubrobacteraceae bacterium]
MLACLILAPASAHAAFGEPAATEAYVTDDSVDAVLQAGTTTYIGGRFTHVARRSGPGVGIVTADGSSAGLPEVTGGAIIAAIGDGSGGWYIGGGFSAVGGVARTNLAHIEADGSVDLAYAPNPYGAVRALALAADGTLYVGGDFTSIGGRSRTAIAALNPFGTALSSFDAHAGAYSTVRTLLVHAPEATPAGTTADVGAVFVGGTFSSMGGQPRNNIASLSPAGTAQDFNPNANNDVYAMHFDDYDRVIVGGAFTKITDGNPDLSGRPDPTRYMAAVDLHTGAYESYYWPDGPVYTLAESPDGSRFYAGGVFTQMLFASHTRLAAFDYNNPNNPRTWAATADGWVGALAVAGDGTVYAGGSFSAVSGQKRSSIAGIDPTTGAATSFDPGVMGNVNVLAASGATLYAGGTFKGFPAKARSRVAAIAADGTVTGFDPGTSSGNSSSAVRALAVSPDAATVYVGGDFTTVGGLARTGLGAVDAVSGSGISSFGANSDGAVLALAVDDDGTVFTAGNFHHIGGASRDAFAALNPATGAVDPAVALAIGGWSYASALAISGNTVYVGGYNGLAATDTDDGTLRFTASGNGEIASLAAGGGDLYVGGEFTTFGGTPRNHIAALDPGTGAVRTSFNPNADGAVRALAYSGSTLYAGGAFTTIGGRGRTYVSGLNPATGAATGFAPKLDSWVTALSASGATVQLGGYFDVVNGSPRGHFARFTDAGTSAAGPAVPTALSTYPDASPGTSLSPKLAGTAEGNTTIRIYTNPGCTGTPIASGSAYTFSVTGGIQLPTVAGNSTTTYYATATDQSAATSACSAGYAYLADATAPTVTITTPADGGRYDQGARIAAAYSCADAGGSGIATCVGDVDNGSAVDTATVGAKSFSVLTTDRAGRTFTRTVQYTVDTVSAPHMGPATDIAAPIKPTAVTSGDLNGDGDPDLVINDRGNGPSVRLGAGGATFGVATPLPGYGNYTTSVTIADVNGDHKSDLVVPSDNTSQVKVGLGNGDGTFMTPVAYSVGTYPVDAEAGDFDGDGDLDLAVADYGVNTVSIMVNDGAGGFTAGAPVTVALGHALAIADFNGDGDPDLAVGSDEFGGVNVVLGTTGTGFGAATQVYDRTARTIAIGDFNGDGDPDLAVSGNGSFGGANSHEAAVSIVLGSTGGTFAKSVEYAASSGAWDIATGDLNGDGTTDLVVANHDAADVSIMTGLANGAFTGPTLVPTGTASNGVTVADFNGDGDLDIAEIHGTNPGALSIILGATQPGRPTLTASTPASGTTETSPKITGTARAGSTVRLYTTAGCTGTIAASGTAAAFASTGLTVTVAAGSTTTFRATATNSAGTSACSSNSVTYTAASPPPPPPPPVATAPGATTGGATATSPTTATVTATVTPADGTTSYWFQYGTVAGALDHETTPVTVGAGGSTSRSADLTGVISATYTYYRVVARQSGFADVSGSIGAVYIPAPAPTTTTSPPPTTTTTNQPPPTTTQPTTTTTNPFLTPPVTPPASDEPTTEEIQAALLAGLATVGAKAKIAPILRAGSFSARLAAPSAGAARIVWSFGRTVVASGSATAPGAGALVVRIKLSTKGKALLKKARSIKLTAAGSFTPTGSAKVVARRTFTLKR